MDAVINDALTKITVYSLLSTLTQQQWSESWKSLVVNCGDSHGSKSHNTIPQFLSLILIGRKQKQLARSNLDYTASG